MWLFPLFLLFSKFRLQWCYNFHGHQLILDNIKIGLVDFTSRFETTLSGYKADPRDRVYTLSIAVMHAVSAKKRELVPHVSFGANCFTLAKFGRIFRCCYQLQNRAWKKKTLGCKKEENAENKLNEYFLARYSAHFVKHSVGIALDIQNFVRFRGT